MKTYQQFNVRVLRGVLSAAFVLLLVGLFSLPQAYAQRGQQGPVDKDEYLNQAMTAMTDQVSLSESQAEQIRTILGEQFDKQQEMRQQMRGQGRERMQAMREQMTALREDTDMRIEALLTDDQVAEYKAFREAQQEKRRGGRTGGRSGT